MTARKASAIVNVGRSRAGAAAARRRHLRGRQSGALMSLTRSHAKELAPLGIRVNAVAPGIIATPFHDAFSTPEMLRNFVATIPLGRVGAPKECATVIAFLASDASSYLIGETIEINGGMLML